MGEGIRAAKIVSLLKKPGDPIAVLSRPTLAQLKETDSPIILTHCQAHRLVLALRQKRVAQGQAGALLVELED